MEPAIDCQDGWLNINQIPTHMKLLATDQWLVIWLK